MGKRLLHSLLAAAVLLGCLWGIRQCASAGMSRLFAAYGLSVKQPEMIEAALRYAPADPEAHYMQALLLSETGQQAEALAEMDRAIKLRPHDYALWMKLGNLSERADYREMALTAYRQAAQHAPYYARPRWQLGNLLFRMGRREEAFGEIRRAISSDPSLLRTAVDFAWNVLDGDAGAVERALEPQTNEARRTLARFFAGRGEALAAINLFRQAGGISAEDRRALLDKLLADKKFAEAYKAWALTGEQSSGGESPHSMAFINDAGFETGDLKDMAFGWQAVRDVHTVRAGLDSNGARSGQKSARIEWNGESDPNLSAISQLILVEPNTNYTLHFAARTEKMVTGGLPIITVTDISGDKESALAQSPALPQGSSVWTDYAFNFKTGAQTSAVRLGVRRTSCQSETCPAFGHAWFDDFSLQKSNG
jgi:tetratricopeptide (TPR) repeat protein